MTPSRKCRAVVHRSITSKLPVLVRSMAIVTCVGLIETLTSRVNEISPSVFIRGWSVISSGFRLPINRCSILFPSYDHKKSMVRTQSKESKESISITDTTELILLDSCKLLGIEVDRKLMFKTHIAATCCKAGKQVNALVRLCKVTTTEVKSIYVSKHL